MILFEFANIQKSKKIIAKRDQYLKELSPHEYALKMKKNESIKEKEFIEFLQSCVLEWEEGEILKLKDILSELKKELNLHINISKPIYIVKTNGLEEWNSAYTRENAIILPSKRINSDDKVKLKKLIIHELFHVISKNFPSLREKLYAILGYKKINNIILSDKLKSIKLTNPDAPTINYCTWVYLKKDLVPVVPIILIKADRKNIDSTQDILKSITTKMLILEEDDSYYKVLKESKLISRQDINRLKNPVANEMKYLEHPEEIIANSFTQVVTGDTSKISQELLNGIYKLLVRE
ncbi:hypothetical protein U472_12155 [Orenia metallireducens]|uniref:Uncharacterized protein n=1 Tax=Orenia metallireducens TaxID=1413210 RepID=A0A1C0A907_9FIRM|nr:hypothetical protein [Orenia metallireducens]OCL26717.1 hypothetical protein U472_12155 [Orenia metallireducens]